MVKELYSYQMANEEDEVGIVRGLAWTSVGGDTLQIEVNMMPGEGEILLTGQLGDVMKESARTGISYIRSVSKEHDIADDFFKKHDIHIHIPEGAVPKDGPSAGITMATAIMSAVTGRKSTGRSCHDRRDYTARTSTSDRRFERKASGCKKCGNEDRTCPGEK